MGEAAAEARDAEKKLVTVGGRPLGGEPVLRWMLYVALYWPIKVQKEAWTKACRRAVSGG